MIDPPTLSINDSVIQYENRAKYLGMTLDAKFCWTEHVKMKRTELDIKYRRHCWLLGRNS